MDETTVDKVALKGLIYERLAENEMKISLILQQGDKIETEIFNLKRQLSSSQLSVVFASTQLIEQGKVTFHCVIEGFVLIIRHIKLFSCRFYNF
jgi:hypothetical protein